MQQGQEIYLHIFSGCHMGASLLLQQGKFLLGSDDSCDFIFMDKSMSAHHAAIEILPISSNLPDKAAFQVKISPLEGKIFFENHEIETETVWEENTLMSFQGVYMAWTTDNSEALLHQISKSMYASSDNVQTGGSQENAGNNEQADGTDPTDKEENANNIDDSLTLESEKANSVAEDKENQEKTAGKKKNYLNLILAVAALLVLVVTFTPIENSEFKETEAVQKYLNDNGFSNIKAIVTDKGMLWQGILKDDAQRAELHAMAQKMHFPVYLDIMVTSDIVKTFTNIFSLKKIYPTVQADREKIFLGYYVKDELYQQILLQTLKSMLPHYEDIKTKLAIKVIYAKELEKHFKEKQETYQIKNITPVFEEGKLVFTAYCTQEEQNKIQMIMDDIQKDVGFKIPYAFLSAKLAEEKSMPAKPGAAASAPAPQDSKNDFSVTGVNTDAIPYITLSTGERVFIGGVLPNGGILEQISLHELTVNHNGSITIYPLRGN